MKLKMRLTVMNFLEYAVWGAYLTSMGSYLVKIGMAENIGWFYSVQGIVSLFMPALIGIIADRWMQGQKVLSLCHFLAGVFMLGASLYGFEAGAEASFSTLFTLYSLSVAFFMPTIALANSVAYSALEGAGLDTVKDFPPIRVFGTVGFICSMWAVDLGGMQENAGQFAFSGVLSLLLAAYALTLPACPVSHAAERKSVVEALGLRAFTLFRQKRMALFFIFSMCLGICLQITNGFASPFIFSFGGIPEYADTFGVQHANILISISQISETFLYFVDTVLFGAFRHQAGDAHSDVGMGVPFRVLRVGQSRVGRVVVCPVHAGLRGGFRLFQCLGFLVCRQGDGHQHTQ